MVPSNIAEAGSSFMVTGGPFKPGQKVWVDIRFQGSYGAGVYCQADKEGLIHPVIDIPEDVTPGDHEVRISTGEDSYNTHLLATLLIHIQAKAK